MPDVTKYGNSTDSALAGDNYDREANAAGAAESIGITVSNTGPVENDYMVVPNSEFGGDLPAPGTYTYVIDISAGDADMDLRVRFQRYNSSDAVQASSSFTSPQTLSTALEYTFSVTGVDLGTFAAGDYLAVHMEWEGTGAHGNAGVTIEHDIAANLDTRVTYNIPGPSLTPVNARRRLVEASPELRM